MPRSASDATRFTATGPYATSKPASTPSSIQIDQGAPANETPHQKIARLRAAAARAKMGKESQFDQVVRVGRVWADRAHRTTAWGLIGLTVVCGVFATFAIGDMLIHNRRKRREWLEEQQKKSAIDLEAAREAFSRGTANENQILLLNRERAAAEAEMERSGKKGVFSKAREAMFGSGSQQDGKVLAEVKATQDRSKTAKVAAATSGFLEDVNTEARSVATQAKESWDRNVASKVGGPLDRQAEATANAVTNYSRGWISWVTGR